MQKSSLPQIFIAPDCLFNDGKGEQGFWIDASLPVSEIHRQIRAMIRLYCEDGCQMWHIKDAKNFQNIKIAPFQSLEEIAAIGQILAIHNTAYALHIKYFGAENTSLESFDKHYHGVWDSKKDFLNHLANELGRAALSNDAGCYLEQVCWDGLVWSTFTDLYVGFNDGRFAYHVFRLD